MRIMKIVLIILVLCVVSVLSLSCASESDSTSVSENQVVPVQRGNLVVDITAAGNLSLSRTEDLAFEIAGTVEEVLVEEGDSVEEGQVLANLDTSEWEEQLTALERALTTAERQLTAKERALTTAERQVTAKELALLQAQINLQTAEDNLYAVEEVQEAQDAVDDAEYDLKFAQAMWEKAVKSESSGAEVSYWREIIEGSPGDPIVEILGKQYRAYSARARLAQAQQDLAEVLAGSSTSVTTEVAREVAIKRLQVELTQERLEDAQVAIEDAQIGVEDAQVAIEDTQVDVKDAQKALDEALDASPEIIASFDGFVTEVNVEGGDEVLKGTVAVVIADPAKFEADILVSEMDILQVKVGGEAWVQVDAMSGLTLPAEVTHISPTATIQSGVVNYEVKVEIQSLEAVTQERQTARQEAMEKIAQGELPERLRQAIEEGSITQEQAEEMMKQGQKGEEGQQGQVPTAIPEDFQLREGLTVTVTIVVEERNDVLLVPNSAITTKGQQTYVQVVSPDGTTEERLIQTGISNWQYTEVTDGLSEGEQIIVPQGTTTTPGGQQPRMPFFPGGGPH